jgi:hypothetical protein
MPTPANLTFTNATYGSYDDDQSTATISVTALKGDSGTYTRYTKNKSIMRSWVTDSYPSGYGMGENDPFTSNQEQGPFFPSIHSGAQAGRATNGTPAVSSPDVGVGGYQQGSLTYTFRGWYNANGNGNTGQTSIWVK